MVSEIAVMLVCVKTGHLGSIISTIELSNLPEDPKIILGISSLNSDKNR